MVAANELSAAERAGAMGGRLLDTFRAGLIAPGAAQLIHHAYTVAVQPRVQRLAVSDIRLLHPARTVLILWQDCNVRNGSELAAAALAESADLDLRPALDSELAELRPLVEPLPVPALAGERLLEDLLSLEPITARIALAERLDHARHLHLRSREYWTDEHLLVRDNYLPLAQRTDPALARRLAWWCEVFERRYLGA